MAYVNFNDIDFSAEGNYGGNRDIKFFSLKNDRESAVVRFIQSTVDDFEIVAVHEVEIATQNGISKRKVSCLREANDPIDKCPFCETNQKLQKKFFVHLVKYEQSQSGEITCTPMVWERPLSFAKELAEKISLYGTPLSNNVFMVTRIGAPKDTKTSYTVDYLPPERFPDTIYKKMEESFKDYKAVGGIVLNKTAQEMIAFVRDGRFPAPQVNNNIPVSNTQNVVPQGIPAPEPLNNHQAPTGVPYNPQVSSVSQVNQAPANPFFQPANGNGGGAINNTPPQAVPVNPFFVTQQPQPVPSFVPNQQYNNPEANLPWNNQQNTVTAPVRVNQ